MFIVKYPFIIRGLYPYAGGFDTAADKHVTCEKPVASAVFQPHGKPPFHQHYKMAGEFMQPVVQIFYPESPLIFRERSRGIGERMVRTGGGRIPWEQAEEISS